MGRPERVQSRPWECLWWPQVLQPQPWLWACYDWWWRLSVLICHLMPPMWFWIYWDPDTKVPVCMQVRKKLCSPYGPAWGQGRTQGRSHSESQRQSSTNWNRWKRNHLKLSGMTKSSAGQQVPMFPARASHPALLKQRWAHLGHTGLTPCPLCSDNTPCFQHVTCMACDLLLLSQSAAYLLY
jgi:hypothetical protein